ncbi:hypothetical protein [Paenibacillus sp. S150]|uniref:hypothetical protein n=1 Tax=Paenibacillus sp. S150 TaxID=2749826 RepID=UPI001C57BEEE|nr:hypothetical protein [Paenibacillus sp. S150]MBW4082931.1 hypothetical protein [Paenibacillus sp. S150]
MADIVRAFIQKGISVEAYTEEIDFITAIIRQEIKIAIDGLSNRLAGLASKDLIMAAASCYSTIAIIADLIDANRYTTFRKIEKKARLSYLVVQTEWLGSITVTWLPFLQQ